MLTPEEIERMRAKVQANSERAKATSKPVALVRYVGGPLDGLTLADPEPLPETGFVGHVGHTPKCIVQAIYAIGERPTVRTFVEYVDGSGKRVRPAAQ